MKKAKVTKVTKFEKKDNYGNTSFQIELENGDKGFYTSKSEEQTKFVVGKECEYNIEEKEGKTGKKYYKITIPQSENAFTGGGGFKSKAPEPRIQMISFAMSYSKDLVVAGKIEFKELSMAFEVIYNEMISKL
jgi:hypothetical protein